MELVWPRCPKCGRRWQAPHPACGTEVAPRALQAPGDVERPELAGLVVERLLGAGGFGEVFLARRSSDGKKVAVKVPKANADAIMRVQLEGEILGQLGGVQAPALYGMPALADGRPCLVMEFLALPTLADRMATVEDGMPLDELGRRARSLLAALEAVHALGLVHRDLKPENVFSTDLPPVTRIFDFGLVQTAAAAAREPSTVATVMGTPEYMAPEQLDASAAVDQRADIYSVGALFYEMLTGRPPFWGNTAEVQQALAHRRVPRPSRYAPGVPPALEELILRCLAKEPDRRFASTAALISAFEAALAQPLLAPAEPRPTPPVPAPARPGDTKSQAAASKHKPMAVLVVQGIAADVLMKALLASGGELADVGRGGGVGVFGEKTSENPVRRALRLADGLLGRKACRAAIIDLASVSVRRRPDGGERHTSAAFGRLQRQLEALDGDGLFLTPAVAYLIPDRRGQARADGALIAASPPPREDEALTVARGSQAPLVGRGDELARLLAAAHASIAERRPGLATVIGELGLGKSHLCAGLVEALRGSRPEAAVIELRVREPIDGEGDENLRALLGRCFALPADKPADRGQALLGELGPLLWPAAALALGWMTPEAPELRALGAAPGVLRAMVSRSVGQALRNRAREQPLALILDDAHFADDATLEAIEYATMAEAETRLWVCVAARPAFGQMKPGWGERSSAHTRVELGPLGAEAATELARRLLFPVEHVASSALEALVTGTQGSPFLLSELVRGLKRDGIVRQDPKGGGWFLASDELAQLPDLAVTDWLAEREIGALPPQLAAHTRLSALLGADFSEDEVEGIIAELERSDVGQGGGDSVEPDLQMDPRVATRQLVTMGVFKRQRDGRSAFRHSLLRAAVEKSVSDRMRFQVHAAAFRFYRAATSMEENVRLPRLALHAASAGHADQAAELYLDLADRARSRHAYVDAEALYSRSLAQPAEGHLRRRMVALRGRGFMRYRMSRHDAVDDLTAALAAARSLEDRRAEIEIILEAATALDWTVEYRKSRELVVEAEALLEASAPAAQTDVLHASLLVGQGRALWRFSKGKQAIEKLRAAVAIAERLGDDAYETRVISLLLLGDLLPYHGEVAEAEQVFETVVSLCEGHGDRAHLMVAFLNRRQLWIGRRNLERALEDSRRSIALAREIGFVAASFMGEYNLTELLYQAGDADAARSHLQRAVDLEQRGLSGVGRPVARLLAARLLTFLGRGAEARAAFESIRAAQAEAERAGQTERLLLPSEQVLLALVDLCTRDATPEEWKELRARAAVSSVEQELIEVVEMTALARHGRGQVDEARQGMDEALSFAASIPNVMELRLRRSHDQVQGAPAGTPGAPAVRGV
jgi:tetratricopeptide (TPR) repeat protein